MLVIGIYYNYFICHIIFKILMDIPKPYRKFAGTALFELYLRTHIQQLDIKFLLQFSNTFKGKILLSLIKSCLYTVEIPLNALLIRFCLNHWMHKIMW